MLLANHSEETSAAERDHRAEFEAFGFTVVRGLLTDDIRWIDDAFTAVMTARAGEHDGTERSTVWNLVEQFDDPDKLLGLPSIQSLVEKLLGGGARYLGSEGSLFVGTSFWHSDNFARHARLLKIAIYLDELDASNGALRLIPASHLATSVWQRQARRIMQHEKALGLLGDEVPAAVADTKPGDIVAFNTNALHSSWNGNQRRRQVALCYARAPRTKPETADISAFVLRRHVKSNVSL